MSGIINDNLSYMSKIIIYDYKQLNLITIFIGYNYYFKNNRMWQATPVCTLMSFIISKYIYVCKLIIIIQFKIYLSLPTELSMYNLF